jgi:hypothetical protein
VGYAIFRAADNMNTTLLGVWPLGGFGMMVDDIAHRFAGTTTLAAGGLLQTFLLNT